MLRIALPNKGRLADDARELLAEAGLGARMRGDRALTASLGGVFDGLFVRAQDIPEFVADGAADAGITGFDLVAESGRDVEIIGDLEFGRCRLVAAAADESGITRLEDIPEGARVATVFPRLTERYFRDACRPDVRVVAVSGAAEIAPHIGIADVIVDLVSTGSTLRSNGLHEIATVLTSTARLIARRRGDAEGIAGRDPTREALGDLVQALTSVLRARDKRYVMANVPRAHLAAIRDVLPGLNGPTVVDILDSSWQVAVHAVVDAGAVYRTVAALKALGGEGILVTRIERLTA